MPFAQLVTGSPGAGKSTYCNGMQQFLSALKPPRKCAVINLDPANDQMGYDCTLDIRDLVTLDTIMEQEALGPNGGVLWALEELEADFNQPDEHSWFKQGLKKCGEDHIIFDCPGQVELFTHHDSLRRIFLKLDKLGYRMTVLHLTDALVLTRPSLYISSLLLALRAMLQLDLPHLNVLTKIDRLKEYSQDLPFNLDFYTEVQDLTYLLPFLDREQRGETVDGEMTDEGVSDDMDKRTTPSRFAALNRALVDLVDDYGLVSFVPLAVEDRKSMMALLRHIDRASGYAFGPSQGTNQSVFGVAMTDMANAGFGENESSALDVRDVQERWIDRRDEMDHLEHQQWRDTFGPPVDEPTPPTADAHAAAHAATSPETTRKHKSTPARTTDPSDMDSDEDEASMAQAISQSGITVKRVAPKND